MLSGALQPNAKHEPMLSNLSGCSRDIPEMIRDSSLRSE
jgi:hypothetical protein